jgi:hypothetical protein
MNKRTRKSQVDVALTIGSIIIPVAALFGSLIFAFVMISQYTDAAKLTSVIAYDIATLADVAYATPDTIKIFYQPPSSCEFIASTTDKKDRISCLNGFLNLSNFYYGVTTQESQIKGGCADVLYSLESSMMARLPDDITATLNGKPVPQPIKISYPAYANIKDQSMIGLGSSGLLPITVNDAVIVQKIRTPIYDSLAAISILDEYDPLYSTIFNMLSACKTEINQTSSSPITMPHNYNLNVSGTVIYLTRFHQSPLNIISDGLDYTNGSTIYSVDTNKLNKNCTFNLNTTFNSITIDYTKTKGNSFIVETNVSCTSLCDNNTKTAKCDGCVDGSAGIACAKQKSGCNIPYYNTLTRIIVTPIGEE